VIYHLFPVRLYPGLIDQIVNRLGFSFEYHDPIKCKDPNDSLLLYDGLYLPTHADYSANVGAAVKETNGIGRQSSQIDFLYGPFSKEKLLNDPRQKFTIIQNPVDHIYEFHRYLQWAYSTWVPSDLRDLKILDIFKDAILVPLNTYIDSILETEGIIQNKQYEFIPELTRLTDFSNYDFVGTIETVDKTIKGLSNFLNIPIQVEDSMKYFPTKENYRRRDLEKMMEEDMEVWLTYLDS
jgi:hypothetical protein